MEDSGLQKRIYRKSWSKLSLITIICVFVFNICIATLLDDDAPVYWIAIIILISSGLFLLISLKRLILPTFLYVNDQGVNFSGFKVEWKDVHDIIISHTPTRLFSFYSIHIIYGSKTVKPLIYYFNGQKAHPTIIIQNYYMANSIWDIYETLRQYQEKYHKKEPS